MQRAIRFCSHFVLRVCSPLTTAGGCNRREGIRTRESSFQSIELKFNSPLFFPSASCTVNRRRGGNILSLGEWKVDRAKGECEEGGATGGLNVEGAEGDRGEIK